MSLRLTEEPLEVDEDFYKSIPQESEHGAQVIPPDYTWDFIKSAQTVDQLYVRIAAGVGQVMPAWDEVLDPKDIWAVSYYVKSLMELKGSPKRKELEKKLAPHREKLAKLKL